MRTVDLVIERFPQLSTAVRQLFLRDSEFRAICEDFSLALESLHRFEARPDAPMRTEVDDYRNLVRELEEELRRHIEADRKDLRR
ncbi:hypothetical protein RGQ15_19835 [Paracoccus sp. MBLB3053]|uniref:Uncharacterized protein n=1 Tax=Paracoccus aurantius TaxID=3073814 RepID=A0ABU2HXN2_9RHOB|nr:hypothetical protein [Paracoccus sp. MBLB3053]MDS9469813.1 hypothetical protein [Paracoccus sp. MBLB3053]